MQDRNKAETLYNHMIDFLREETMLNRYIEQHKEINPHLAQKAEAEKNKLQEREVFDHRLVDFIPIFKETKKLVKDFAKKVHSTNVFEMTDLPEGQMFTEIFYSFWNKANQEGQVHR